MAYSGMYAEVSGGFHQAGERSGQERERARVKAEGDEHRSSRTAIHLDLGSKRIYGGSPVTRRPTMHPPTPQRLLLTITALAVAPMSVGWEPAGISKDCK